MASQFKPPNDAPPGYPQPPQPAYYEGGGSSTFSGGDQRMVPGNEYGSPAPGPYYQQGPYGPPPGPYGPPPGPYGPGPYGPGPYYQQQGQPMYYQQAPVGYYDDGRGGPGGAGAGICAGLMGALACCCCLDLLL